MSGEPNYLTIRDLAYWQSRKRHRSKTGPRPTLGDLHRSTPWLWMHCEQCQHHAPLACAVAVIRWGADAPSDKLRQCARCTKCGSKGATIQHPGWAGNQIGFAPFPTRYSAGDLQLIHHHERGELAAKIGNAGKE